MAVVCNMKSINENNEKCFDESLLSEIRNRFYYADNCPFQGPRIYFENAGGSLTLKSVIQVTSDISAIPDNEHRNNKASEALMKIVNDGKKDLAKLFKVNDGIIFGGETGTECLFRLIRTAALEGVEGGSVIACSLEHPATFDATRIWAKKTNREWIEVPFDVHTGIVSAEHYAKCVRPDTRIATIIHTNPVTGMVMDVKAIAEQIRQISPDCFIIVDGIQHAPHGVIGVSNLDVDAYVISLYKVFSKFNNGYAWVSERLAHLPHDKLLGKPLDAWELGSRDPAALAAASEVIHYLEWLGSHFQTENSSVDSLALAGRAISAHEQYLIRCLLEGLDDAKGLEHYSSVMIIGDLKSSNHESVVSFAVQDLDSRFIVSELSNHGIRVHTRSADAYSGNILNPLGLESVTRVSLGHYNTEKEVYHFLKVFEKIVLG